MKITLKVAFERLIACLNLASWALPSMVRWGSLIFARQAGGTGLPSCGTSELEGVADALRGGWSQVGAAAARRVVAGPVVVGAAAAEGALVEEEDLEVLAPAVAPVEPGLLRVADGVVVAERLHAPPVEGLAVDVDVAARLGEDVLELREVVDELVIVPVGVVGGCATRLDPGLLAEVELVLLPLLGNRQRNLVDAARAGDLRVGVDRVAHQHVEVVVLGPDPVPELEVVPVGLRLPGHARGILVAGEREADRLRLARRRRRLEAAGRAVPPAAHAPAVVVLRPGPQAADPLLHGPVVVGRDLGLQARGVRRQLAGAEPLAARDLGQGGAGALGAGPEDRRVLADITGDHAVAEAPLAGRGGSGGDGQRRQARERGQEGCGSPGLPSRQS